MVDPKYTFGTTFTYFKLKSYNEWILTTYVNM